MADEITEKNIDDLADIIWWLKGYLQAKNEDCGSTDFSYDHIEALRKARLLMKDAMKGSGEEDDVDTD